LSSIKAHLLCQRVKRENEVSECSYVLPSRKDIER
jgi:hypothetical protein